MIKTVGSICSGIEAASVAWESLGVNFDWFSEIAPFPSRVLAEKYPSIPNLGDMNGIPELIKQGKISAPDLICGGTPCQAFSLAGWQNGLNDDRGNLTLKFVDIIESNDAVRLATGQNRCKVFWENVEGVLTDKTNAFGCLISSLAGLANVLTVKGGRWPNAGLVRGKTRNVAWRVLDAKYFGLPQQRRRLYVVVEKISAQKRPSLKSIKAISQNILHQNWYSVRMDTNLRCSVNTQTASILLTEQSGMGMQRHIMALCLLYRIIASEDCLRSKQRD